MTKKIGTGTGKSRKSRIPGWLKDLDPTPEDLGIWEYVRGRGLSQLQHIYMVCAIDLRRMRQSNVDLMREGRERIKGLEQELAAAKRENLGRIQSNLMQTMQSMMAALEGNSRSVHALAEPVGELLVRLGKEMGR